MLSRRRTLPLLALLGIITPIACGPSAPEPALPVATASAHAAVEPPDGPMPKLRAGAFARVDATQVIEGRVSARSTDDRYETIAIDLVLPSSQPWQDLHRLVVSVDGAPLGPWAFASPSREPGGQGAAVTVWIRRPLAEQGKPLAGALYTAQHAEEPGRRLPFHATVDPALKSDPTLVSRWAKALSTDISGRGTSPWHQFAAARIDEVFAKKTKKPAPGQGRGPARVLRAPTRDLERLMDTTTGAMSIQEALQADRPLLLGVARDRPTIPLAKLAPPRGAPHPWDELLRSLGKPAPAELLAASVPAEFYYLRATDLDVLFKLSDQLDAWGTPLVGVLDRRASERFLAARYETQLGLARTALARALGKEVVAQVALAGSDPYLREGSDVSVIFQVLRRSLFDVGLAGTLGARAAEHGGVTMTTVPHEGVDVRVATSADGAVRQHRATVGDLEIVSNSLVAIKRILDTIKGKHPRLADEKDFAYLLARDAGVRADALGFMGDRFVGEVVGPRQKVLEARRQIALAELMTPGLAALLHGWLTGRSPASVEELFAARLLSRDELAHGNGAPIAWKPGEAARSAFGTPAALTPILELPDPALVTEAERDAYDRWSRSYESYWRTYIDPAALRVAVDVAPSGTTLTADLRVMPLIEGTDYRDILEMAGQARVTAPPFGAGARLVVGIGAKAKLRRELSSLARGFVGKHGFALDFLGEWAMLGVEDRPALAETVIASDRHPSELPDGERRPELDSIGVAARTPAYVAIGLKSTAGAAIALVALHALADEVLPGAVTWAEAGKERGVPIVRVAVAEDFGRGRAGDGAAGEKQVELFYALTNGVFLVALREGTLRRRLGELLDGHGPGPAASGSGSQLVVDVSGEKQGAIFTVLSWLLTEETLDAAEPSRALAEALLVGARERAADPAAVRALGIAYLGAAPVSAEGGAWTLGPDGVRHPTRGTASAPVWPALPVPGSPVDRLLGAVGRFHSELAFDREGSGKGSQALLSLHARVTLGLRGE